MEDRILFDPENRLLGSSTGDLSQYGGQSDPGLAIGAARGDTPDSLPAASIFSQHFGDAVQPSPLLFTPEQEVALAAGDPAPDSGARSVQPFLVSAPAEASPLGPVHLGGGPDMEASLTLPPAQGLSPFAPGSVASAQGLADAGTASAGLDAAVSPSVDATLPAANAVADIATIAGDGLGGGVHGLVHAIDGLAGTLAVSPELLSVGLDSLAGDASPILGGAGEALGATVGAAGDSLADLAGSDPAAGVATLVSLVSVSDMFDLPALNAPIADASADPGIVMLDALAADELIPEPLLGTHDHDGAIDHLGGLDHHIGL